MKFRATFSDRGLKLLEKGFLPCMEKHGKTCTLLAGPTDLHFVQMEKDTDGMRVTARWAKEVLFDAYSCHSQCNNLVAFTIDVSLMLRVLRSAHTNAADSVDMKLCMRTLPSATPVSEGSPGVSKPFLAFSSKGHNMNMVQDMPVSKPMNRSEIEEQEKGKDLSEMCPFYLDLLPDILRLQALVDKLKGLSGTATLVVTRQGHLHLQAAAPSVHVASEIQGLDVYPRELKDNAQPLTASLAEGRMQQALANGEAASAVIQLKHLARTLHAATILNPGQAMCGIDPAGAYVHFIFAFSDAEAEGGYDDRLQLSCKLPVREE